MAHNIYYVLCYLCVGIHDWNVILGFFLGLSPAALVCCKCSAICSRGDDRECRFCLFLFGGLTFFPASRRWPACGASFVLYILLEL